MQAPPDLRTLLHSKAESKLEEAPSLGAGQLFVAILPPYSRPRECEPDDFLWLLMKEKQRIGKITALIEERTGFQVRLTAGEAGIGPLSEETEIRVLDHFKDGLVALWVFPEKELSTPNVTSQQSPSRSTKPGTSKTLPADTSYPQKKLTKKKRKRWLSERAAHARDSKQARALARDSKRIFRCSINGCVKSYQQQAGLRYHEIHGHKDLLQKTTKESDDSHPSDATSKSSSLSAPPSEPDQASSPSEEISPFGNDGSESPQTQSSVESRSSSPIGPSFPGLKDANPPLQELLPSPENILNTPNIEILTSKSPVDHFTAIEYDPLSRLKKRKRPTTPNSNPNPRGGMLIPDLALNQRINIGGRLSMIYSPHGKLPSPSSPLNGECISSKGDDPVPDPGTIRESDSTHAPQYAHPLKHNSGLGVLKIPLDSNVQEPGSTHASSYSHPLKQNSGDNGLSGPLNTNLQTGFLRPGESNNQALQVSYKILTGLKSTRALDFYEYLKIYHRDAGEEFFADINSLLENHFLRPRGIIHLLNLAIVDRIQSQSQQSGVTSGLTAADVKMAKETLPQSMAKSSFMLRPPHGSFLKEYRLTFHHTGILIPGLYKGQPFPLYLDEG